MHYFKEKLIMEFNIKCLMAAESKNRTLKTDTDLYSLS